VLATVATVGVGSMRPAQAASTPVDGGVYQLAAGASGKCVDVVGASTANGALLQQYTCAWTSTNQQFRVVARGSGRFNLVSVNSGRCVDVPGGAATAGLQLQQWGCGDGTKTNQLWTFTASSAAPGKYRIAGVATGLCVSDKDGSTSAGNPVVQEACADIARMQWSFNPVPASTTPATVAADGTGTYRTVQAAIDAVPANNTTRRTITIKPGTYREIVTVPANKPYISLQGLGTSAGQTVIVNNHDAGTYGTSGSATAFINGHDFMATNLTMSNDFDETTPTTGAQALALNLAADRSIFANVRLLGDQDTFYNANGIRAYVVNSYIEGTVDFVFGGGTVVFNNTQVYEKRATGGPITAASTPATQTYGYLFYRCTITGTGTNVTTLGRPWRADAQVLFRESSLSDDPYRAAVAGLRHHAMDRRALPRVPEHRDRCHRQRQPPATHRRAGGQLHAAALSRRLGWMEPGMKRRPTLRVILAVGALVVPASVVGLASLPAQAATAPVTGGRYQLASGASGKCVNVVGASTANGALLEQLACVGTSTSQQFDVTATANLANVLSGRCVDVPSSSTVSGVQLQQWGCGDGTKANQQWTFVASAAATGKYRVVNVASGLCLSDRDGSTAGGNPIVQETCADVARMQWSFNLVGGVSPTTGPSWSNTADGFAAGTTGGAGGTTVTVTTLADLVRYAAASTPYVIRVNASITVTPYGYEIPVASNKTIIGVGRTGELVHGGLHLNRGTHNVIIRNLTIRDTRMADDDPDDKTYDYDGIQMDTADHIWIDHNTITRMNDGLIDSRLDTTFLTVSWNVLAEGNKAFGIGWTDNVTSRMTIHHNWIHDTNQRNPSTDNVAYAHLYNNYLQNITSYGNLSRGATKMVLENSYFDTVANPYYNDTSAAQLRQSGSVLVNCTGRLQTNGPAFTPGSFYSYSLDPAASVPALLRTGAGPQANLGG
jgi:pectin methylesterase-like acyl-CoA thioesterase/pectate lyase